MTRELGLLVMLMMAATTGEAARPRLDVLVAVEADVTLRASDLNQVVRAVREMWRPAADVVLDLSSCGPRQLALVEPAARSGCAPRRESGAAVTLVLTNRVRRVSGPALGWIDFVDGVPQPLVTVSVTEVIALMQNGRWHGRSLETMAGTVRAEFVRRALSRAIAHEIGHYLLGSSAHRGRGLMQASFSVDDIMDAAMGVPGVGADDVARVAARAPLAVRANSGREATPRLPE